MKKELPNTEIVVIVNTELKDEVTNALKTASRLYGVKCVVLRDIDKDWGHPTAQGMSQICEQVAEELTY